MNAELRELLELHPEHRKTRSAALRASLSKLRTSASGRLPRLRWRRLRLPAEILEDAALLAGLAAIAAGCGWIYPPTAAIVGGGFLVWLGLRAARSAGSEPQLREPTQVVNKYVFGDDDEDD